MVEWIVVLVALIILVGEYSAVLWLPALAASIWLVVKEPRSRKVLLPLAVGCLVCMLSLWKDLSSRRPITSACAAG